MLPYQMSDPQKPLTFFFPIRILSVLITCSEFLLLTNALTLLHYCTLQLAVQ